MPITDNICFTNFKSHGKLKFVSIFIFDIILYTEKCYKVNTLNMKENNFKNDIGSYKNDETKKNGKK